MPARLAPRPARDSAAAATDVLAMPADPARAPLPPPHAWTPVSPCGSGCVEAPAGVHRIRRIARVLGVAGVLAAFPIADLLTPAKHRAPLHRWCARLLLRCCGIRMRVIDQRGTGAEAPAGSGLLVVAGHIGWADVLALAAISPMGFVARADLVAWPVLGRVARLMRVIPIERDRLRQLPEVVAAMAARLAAGERVGMFPEGTTWCGRAHGRLRPALFQAAVDTTTPVQPIRLRYLGAEGEVSTVPAFVGADGFLDSVRRVLRAEGVVAELVLLPVELPGSDRRDLARRCERALRGPGEIRVDEEATALGTGPTREIVTDGGYAARSRV